MNRDLERRLRRLEQDNEPDQIRYEVSSVPLCCDEDGRLMQGSGGAEPGRPLTEDEWAAECARGRYGAGLH
jgi:hypothetical protein